jgi:hypothetical protein
VRTFSGSSRCREEGSSTSAVDALAHLPQLERRPPQLEASPIGAREAPRKLCSRHAHGGGCNGRAGNPAWRREPAAGRSDLYAGAPTPPNQSGLPATLPITAQTHWEARRDSLANPCWPSARARGRGEARGGIQNHP